MHKVRKISLFSFSLLTDFEQCGAKSVAEFQRLTTEEQTRIVKATKAEGASIRQVMSHTGWSYRRVREAGGGAAVKS